MSFNDLLGKLNQKKLMVKANFEEIFSGQILSPISINVVDDRNTKGRILTMGFSPKTDSMFIDNKFMVSINENSVDYIKSPKSNQYIVSWDDNGLNKKIAILAMS